MKSLSATADAPLVSVVIPCRDEAENLPALIDEIGAALADTRYEAIVDDDGSADDSTKVLADLASARPWLRHLRHVTSCGQSAAVRIGLPRARGEIVASLDGDGQNAAAYLPMLVARLDEASHIGIVAGQREKRTDTGLKRLASRFANGLRSAALKDRTMDSGCGLEALRRKVFLLLPYFDRCHHCPPALVIGEGYGVAHMPVVDGKRRHGKSKYGIIGRGLVGILDLLGVVAEAPAKRIPEVTEIDFHDR